MIVSIISDVSTRTRILSWNPVQGQQLYRHALVRELHGARIARSDHQKSRLDVPLICDYVRVLRPELDCCTRRERAGAAIEVRARGMDGCARARYIRRAFTLCEHFVIVIPPPTHAPSLWTVQHAAPPGSWCAADRTAVICLARPARLCDLATGR